MSMAKEPIRDPHYRQIVSALEGPLDPALFERVMGDLLRDVFPGLVPVPGGQDSGFDGAVADGEGEPYPLVCTVGLDVERNLRESLRSYLRTRRPRHKAAIATSRSLTPKQRQRLSEAAREQGFELIQVFDRSAIADRLYYNSRWCRELLELSGKPSALSAIPKSRRPLLDLEPVGREADLAWIREQRGDRVLVGQPGSGKTFLFHHLIHRQGWNGLFVVDSDQAALANALRDLRPATVVVDDAHVRREALESLRHLRQEGVGEPFEIVAITWEGERDAILESLGGHTAARKLEPLTRHEILEVFRQAGVEPRDDLMVSLIDQAAQKPGLAVTLAELWLQGEWQAILRGEALSRTLLHLFRDLTGTDTSYLLACFSLGGSEGMSLEAVSEFLGRSRAEVLHLATNLAAAGVLSTRGRDVLVVSPEVLRFALVRRVFFPESGWPAFFYREILPKAPSFSAAVETLVGAKLCGAPIAELELWELVKRCPDTNSSKVWELLARVSDESALWVLEHFPGKPTRIASATLLKAPRETILRLLPFLGAEKAANDSNSPGWILQEWQNDPRADPTEILARRRQLVETSIQYLRSGGLPADAAWGIRIALDPRYSTLRMSPAGSEATHSLGFSPALRALPALWELVCEALPELGDPAGWGKQLRELLWAWMHPRVSGVPVEEAKEVMRTFATTMLRDLAPWARTVGWAAVFLEMAGTLGITLPLEPDRDFELLYPGERDRKDEAGAEIRALVEKWTRDAPEPVAARLSYYQREAKAIGRHPITSQEKEAGEELATRVDDPMPWATAILEAGLGGYWAHPVLQRIVREQRPGWEDLLGFGFSRERSAYAALSLLLTLDEPPGRLLQSALKILGDYPQAVEGLCSGPAVSPANVRILLRHPDVGLALSAAFGVWSIGRKVSSDLAAEWREVFLRPWQLVGSLGESPIVLAQRVGDVLSSDSELAYEWILARFRDPKPGLPTDFLARVVQTLEAPQQAELLARLESRPEAAWLRQLLDYQDDLAGIFLRNIDLPPTA